MSGASYGTWSLEGGALHHRDMNYITVKQLADHLGVSPATIYRSIEAHRLPVPLRISPHTIRWRRVDLEAIFGPIQ
jgi:predicted DNA-binding transcriptional regulator AlpA